MENQTYDVDKAIEAQKEYCKEFAAKHPEDGMHDSMSRGQGFAPMNGVCYRCHRQMYSEGGISVERARRNLTTGCPFCHYSFVE